MIWYAIAARMAVRWTPRLYVGRKPKGGDWSSWSWSQDPKMAKKFRTMLRRL